MYTQWTSGVFPVVWIPHGICAHVHVLYKTLGYSCSP